MIYLDSAATSFHKPYSVYRAVERAMKTMTGPGRGAHQPALLAAQTAFMCRIELAELFHVPNPEQVVFTANATHALNIAIHDLVGQGDRVVVSGYEHNSVMRPLFQIGADVHVVRTSLFDDENFIRDFERQIYGAKAVVCTAMSNVFGYITPIGKISTLCKEANIPLIVDASQLAGSGELNFTELGATFVAFPGHKGLLGPQGTGVLLCGKVPRPLMSGGSGSESRLMEMPSFLPDRLEAGTHNMVGIAGLLEGVRYIRRTTVQTIAQRERKRLDSFVKEIQEIEELETFYSLEPSKQGGVLSVRHSKIDSERLTMMLGDKGVAVRGGLHCAPFAHETAGTETYGTVRFSFSPFISEQEVKRAAQILKQCVNKQRT